MRSSHHWRAVEAQVDITARTGRDNTLPHDASLLVAALEDIEARRAAMEFLLEANLLCLCLG